MTYNDQMAYSGTKQHLTIYPLDSIGSLYFACKESRMFLKVLKFALDILFMTYCLDSNETGLIIVDNFLTLAKLFFFVSSRPETKLCVYFQKQRQLISPFRVIQN